MAIYLDNAATTKPAEEVVTTITECLTEHYGNPSSLHKIGLDAELIMTQARKNLAQAIGDEPNTILFTSGATESSNLAIRGAGECYGKRKKHIVTSAVEHASVKSTIDSLEEQGFTVTRIFPDQNGEFQADDFINAVNENTFLVSMMMVENETGRILPVKDVFRAVKRKYPDVILHCDAVQAFMKFPVKANELKADLISMSAHKIHGAKGTGALYIRKGIRLKPIITGGKQERAIRAGTESVPLIAGFGKAVEIMQPTIQERFTKMQELKKELLSMLANMEDITINSSEKGTPYIVNFSVKGIRSEIMLHFLESKEIYVSSGSACSKGKQSGVLDAYKIPDTLADCAIRVSFSEETTVHDLRILAEAIHEGQKSLIHKK